MDPFRFVNTDNAVIAVLATVIIFLSIAIVWITQQWRKSEEQKGHAERLRLEADELRINAADSSAKALREAEQRARVAEEAALDVRNEMPSIVAEYFQRIEGLFAEKYESLRQRLRKTVERVRELESELTQLKSRHKLADDDVRRLSDDIEGAEEEIEEISRLAENVQRKREAIAKTLPVLQSPELAPELVEAAESAINEKIARSSAHRTTVRVVERERASLVAKAATTNAQFKAMEEKLALLERQLQSAEHRAMQLQLDAND